MDECCRGVTDWSWACQAFTDHWLWAGTQDSCDFMFPHKILCFSQKFISLPCSPADVRLIKSKHIAVEDECCFSILAGMGGDIRPSGNLKSLRIPLKQHSLAENNGIFSSFEVWHRVTIHWSFCGFNGDCEMFSFISDIYSERFHCGCKQGEMVTWSLGRFWETGSI